MTTNGPFFWWLQKEEKIALILLVVAFLSIYAVYWGFVEAEAGYASLGEQRMATIEGKIIDAQETHSSGHMILRMEGSPISVFVPADVVKGISGELRRGARVRVQGSIQDYKGREELVLRRIKDLTVLD